MGPHSLPASCANQTHDKKAVASLLLGVASVVLCLGAVAGVPAILLGAMARRDIDRSGGRLQGAGLAAGGIMAGLSGTGLGLVILLSLMGSGFELAKEELEAPPGASAQTRIGANAHSYGPLDVIDLDEDKALRAQLADITAKSSGRTIVLQTFSKGNKECARIASSLGDRRMQVALANVTLVRADVERFGAELRAMEIETDTLPWFYRLDASSRPEHGITRTAWDDTSPEKLAPVLARFVTAR